MIQPVQSASMYSIYIHTRSAIPKDYPQLTTNSNTKTHKRKIPSTIPKKKKIYNNLSRPTSNLPFYKKKKITTNGNTLTHTNNKKKTRRKTLQEFKLEI